MGISGEAEEHPAQSSHSSGSRLSTLSHGRVYCAVVIITVLCLGEPEFKLQVYLNLNSSGGARLTCLNASLILVP